jgi:hypothetical protein
VFVSLVSAVFCPHPMMLIPDVVAETGGAWGQVRSACAEAVGELAIPVWDREHAPSAAAPHLVVIVGGDDTTRSFDPARAYGSLRASGVNWEYGWGSDHAEAQPLPLSLTVGYWLLVSTKSAGIIVGDIAFQAIDFDASPQECAALGQDLARRAKRVALLVMGEGTTCMAASAWPYWGERARQCDATVSRALEHADAEELSGLNPLELRPAATGRAAWQVAAGAARGQQFHSRLHLDTTGSALGYFVASWTARSP